MKSNNTQIVAAPNVSGLTGTEGTRDNKCAPAQEPYVNVAYVCKQFGMSRTTVWRNITKYGMPKHTIGNGYCIRFLVSEVQEWLEKNERIRFAANGRRSALEEARKRILLIPVLKGIEIVERSDRR